MESKFIFVGIVFVILLILGAIIGGTRFDMVQSATGNVKHVKKGFSFTYMLFGPLTPLFRGHIGGFFLTLLVEIFSIGIARFILCFTYNSMYINHLVSSGYVRCDNQSHPQVVIYNSSVEKSEPVIYNRASDNKESEKVNPIINRIPNNTNNNIQHKYCDKCGEKLSLAMKFCGKCGAMQA